MNKEDDANRLRQAARIARLSTDISMTDMVTVYLSHSGSEHNHGIYCALIPNNMVEQCLEHPEWDLLHGDGAPGAVVHESGGQRKVEYLRYGDDSGIEPLILDREFYGIRTNYREISEEFRLFHGLYHDRKLDQFIRIDADGNEHIVATITNEQISIR